MTDDQELGLDAADTNELDEIDEQLSADEAVAMVRAMVASARGLPEDDLLFNNAASRKCGGQCNCKCER